MWPLHNDRISILVSRDTKENELQCSAAIESFSFVNFNLRNSEDATGENPLAIASLFSYGFKLCKFMVNWHAEQFCFHSCVDLLLNNSFVIKIMLKGGNLLQNKCTK